MSFLIFAGNLHSGGGVQVAASFIHELPLLGVDLSDVDVILSSRVNEELLKIESNTTSFRKFDVQDYFGWELNTPFNSKSRYSVCFVIFGPIYFRLPADKIIVGFAQPWIAFPKNDALKKMGLLSSLKTKIKYGIQRYFFTKYDILLVEHEIVKNSLISIGFKNRIEVVSNSCSKIFSEEEKWENCHFPKLSNDTIILGYVGRAYMHKNLAVLRDVSDVLLNKFKVSVNFVFTLSEKEMDELLFTERENFHSVGEINLTQCPDFYSNIDALIFPTMLECFSATPLEAMTMSKPVLASDYPFITGVCKCAGIYFDANDPNDIADKIYSSLVDNPDLLNDKISKGKTIIASIPSSSFRAKKFWEMMNNEY